MIALISIHYTVKLINPSDAVAIFGLKTIIVSIIGRILLKEKMNITHFICLFLSVIGVLLITQPTFLFSSLENNINNLNNSGNFSLAINQTHKNRKESIKFSIGITFGKKKIRKKFSFFRFI